MYEHGATASVLKLKWRGLAQRTVHAALPTVVEGKPNCRHTDRHALAGLPHPHAHRHAKLVAAVHGPQVR